MIFDIKFNLFSIDLASVFSQSNFVRIFLILLLVIHPRLFLLTYILLNEAHLLFDHLTLVSKVFVESLITIEFFYDHFLRIYENLGHTC
jgi:hypothetical protein